MLDKWDLVSETGYRFEFEHEDYIHVTISIFTTKGEKVAWNKLEDVLNDGTPFAYVAKKR